MFETDDNDDTTKLSGERQFKDNFSKNPQTSWHIINASSKV